MPPSEFTSRVSSLFKELCQLQQAVDSDVQLLGVLPVEDYFTLTALFKEYNFIH